jgi:hypothetical protein
LTISSSRGVSGSVGTSRRLGAVEVVADQRGDRRRVEERLAAHRRAAGLDEVAVGGALEHVAGRPAFSASKKYCSLSYIESISVRSSGRRRRSSAAACRPVSCGIATSSTARSTSVAARARPPRRRRRPRRPRQVGLGVEDHPQAPADHRVIVGEQDPVFSGTVIRHPGQRHVEAHLGPPASTGADA